MLSRTILEHIRELQEIAVEESRLGIPLLFAFDTIHGFRTIFPIPLGTGASFDPDVEYEDAKFGARESTAVGLKQTYAPMVDVSHEPRWGRISEGAGEDPYLNSVLGAARVKGTQGSDYGGRDKLAASPKHFAAYGEPEAGRDYATTDMSVQRLWNIYLPPFKAAIDAGADTAMCSFNAINGVPGCGHDELMNEVLKDDWDFDGFVEGDWTAVAELRAARRRTRPCRVRPRRRRRGPTPPRSRPTPASTRRHEDVHPTSASSCSRERKSRCGGSTTPCAGSCASSSAPACSKTRTRCAGDAGRGEMLKPDAVAAARKAASRSMVLLQNEGGVLPLRPRRETAVIGPLARTSTTCSGRGGARARRRRRDRVRRHRRAEHRRRRSHRAARSPTPRRRTRPGGLRHDAGFAEAVAVAQAADQVVLALGETREMSGEANSRSTLDLPGRQEELIAAIVATGKPFAVVLFSGRPLALENIVGDAPAILQAWFPGVQAGPAVADWSSAGSTRAASCP